jgi:hypothetical protein
VKTTVAIGMNFPGAPDAFALAKAATEDIVRAGIGVRPVTLAGPGVVSAPEKKQPDIIVAIAAKDAVRESETEIHAMPVAGPVIVKAGPRARRKPGIVHKSGVVQ